MPSLPTNPDPSTHAHALQELIAFRSNLYASLTRRADELFELTDALLCTPAPVATLVDLSLAPEHRRGHGALYAALNRGGIDLVHFGRALAGLRLPRMAGGRIVLAVDTSPWLRPSAATSPARLHCHVGGRGKQARWLPGWPYSVVAALEAGRTSWTQVLDARRIGPDDEHTVVTATQVREVVGRLLEAGHQQPEDPDILIVADAGYDLTRLAWLLADLPVTICGRIRADRVLCLPAPPPDPTASGGRPRRHGAAVHLAKPATHPAPAVATTTPSRRYGTATATAFDRLHPRLVRRSAWAAHTGVLPVIEGTVIHLEVEHLPGRRRPEPMWLWAAAVGLDAAGVDWLWQAYLRRFDLEHTFRFLKQTLGWTTPRLRDPAAADRWTLLVIAAVTQLRLARGLTAQLRRPWERPLVPARLTPGRVRRGFRYLRARLGCPAEAPQPSRGGPGRPKGATNRQATPRYQPGKTIKREIQPKKRTVRQILSG